MNLNLEHWKKISNTLFAIIALCVSGCATLPQAETINGGNSIEQNRKILERDFKHEWAFNRKSENRNNPPELGLALSGGGTRSASFSIGVLKALQEKGILDKIDVISAVSGGAYAAYWYFMQNCYLNIEPGKEHCPTREGIETTALLKAGNGLGKNIQDIFTASSDSTDAQVHPITNVTDPNIYRFQLTLENSSNILSYEKKPGIGKTLRNAGQYVADLGLQIISIPLNWAVNGLILDEDANVNPYRHFYQNGIERTFGYVPLDYELTNFANSYDYPLALAPRVNAVDVSFSDLRKYLESKRNAGTPMPYFIINATASVNRYFDRVSNRPKQLRTAVYEFTPWQCGSGLTAYNSIESDACPSEITIGRAVSIAGAAVDGQNESIDQAGKSEGVIRTLAGMQNILNLNIGYNIKNPRANPVARAIHKITPFPVYFINDILEGNTPCDVHLSDGGHIENLGVYSLVRRGTKNIIVVDAEEDHKTIFESLKRLKYNLESELGLHLEIATPKKPENNYDTPLDEAFTLVRITGLESTINLYYIKLSLDQTKLQAPGGKRDGKYPFSVTSFQNSDPQFPHDPTSDIFYSPEQYRAYRDLGHYLGMMIDTNETYGEQFSKVFPKELSKTVSLLNSKTVAVGN